MYSCYTHIYRHRPQENERTKRWQIWTNIYINQYPNLNKLTKLSHSKSRWRSSLLYTDASILLWCRRVDVRRGRYEGGVERQDGGIWPGSWPAVSPSPDVWHPSWTLQRLLPAQESQHAVYAGILSLPRDIDGFSSGTVASSHAQFDVMMAQSWTPESKRGRHHSYTCKNWKPKHMHTNTNTPRLICIYTLHVTGIVRRSKWPTNFVTFHGSRALHTLAPWSIPS